MMETTLIRKARRAAGFAGLTLRAGAKVAWRLHFASSAERPALRDHVTAEWSNDLLSLFGIDVVTRGEVVARERGRGRIVVANHRSIIDIAILLSTFGGALLSRGDLEKWPIVGPAARAAGTIFVDRGDRTSGRNAISAMVDRLAEHDTICLFPEGTTYVDDEVRPFKPGAFVAASRAGVPVVPVGLTYPLDSGAAFGGETFLEHLGHLAETAQTTVHVEIGAPLELGAHESVDDFKERCRGEVARLVKLARARHAQR